MARKKNNVSAEETRKRIEKKAYELWQKRGYAHGTDWNDWFEAEKVVNSEK